MYIGPFARAAKTIRMSREQPTSTMARWRCGAGQHPPSAELGILTLYWLVSGYALRAWRAFTAVMLTLVLFAVLMVGFGFRDPNLSSETATTATALSS